MIYTDDEISDIIQHMGYQLPQPDELERIKQGLLEFDDADDINDLINLPFQHDLAELYNHFDHDQYIEDFQDDEHKEYTQLLKEAYNTANNLYKEIIDIDQQIQYELSTLPQESRVFIEEMFHQEASTSGYSEESLSLPEPSKPKISVRQDKRKVKEKQPKMTNIEQDENAEPILIDEQLEQELIDEILRERGIRRVHCPEPGRAPYKHDPVARNQMYQQMWKTLPIPDNSCKRRKALRWKMRELMMRKDMPVLKLVPNSRIKSRPLWVD